MGEDRYVTVYSQGSGLAERVVAEVHAAGASGVLEEVDGDRIRLTIYLESEWEGRIGERLRAFAEEGLVLEPFGPIENRAWSEAWKEGHEAIEISPRLVVRPPFADRALSPGQHEIVIDPGQAFGTGRHESTQLALQCLDALLLSDARGAQSLLDVGTGSGVLAMAGLRLGVVRAVGFDLDKVATLEARRHGRVNGLGAELRLFAGPITALRNARFDLVVVNMLRSEILPIASEIAACVGGRLVLSGLLDADLEATLARFSEEGLVLQWSREALDDSGNRWVGLCLERP